MTIETGQLIFYLSLIGELVGLQKDTDDKKYRTFLAKEAVHLQNLILDDMHAQMVASGGKDEANQMFQECIDNAIQAGKEIATTWERDNSIAPEQQLQQFVPPPEDEVIHRLVATEALSMVESIAGTDSITVPSSNEIALTGSTKPKKLKSKKNMSEISLRIDNLCQSVYTVNANFLDVLESRLVSAELNANEIYFILGNCSISTIFNIVVSDICKGNLKLEDIDEMSRLTWLTLKGKMNLVSHVKENAIASARIKYASTSHDAPLSSALQKFASDKGAQSLSNERQVREESPMVTAARKAAKEHDGTTNWITHASFTQQVQNSLGNLALLTALFRVLTLFTFDSLKEALCAPDQSKLEDFRPFCEHIVVGEPVGDHTLDWIYDFIILPATKRNTPHSLEAQMKAFQLSEFILAKMSSTLAIPAFDVAESVPGSVSFKSCNNEQRLAYKERKGKGYLTEKDDSGNVVKTSQRRRRLACDLLFRTHCGDRLVQLLERRGHMDEARVLSFGLLCMPPFTFARSAGHKLLFDIRMYQSDSSLDTYIKSVLDGPLAFILKKIAKVIDAYEADTVFVDVTDDLKNNEQHAYDVFSALFDLIVCDIETDDNAQSVSSVDDD